MCNCFTKKSLMYLFIKKQRLDEYKKRKENMSYIGINIPKSVYKGYSNDIQESDIIPGLNSLCLCEIHIAVSNSPSRIILSFIDIKDGNKLIKGDTFHIYNISYKQLNNISDINQYDIYNAIQDYIYIYKKIPSNDKIIVST